MQGGCPEVEKICVQGVREVSGKKIFRALRACISKFLLHTAVCAQICKTSTLSGSRSDGSIGLNVPIRLIPEVRRSPRKHAHALDLRPRPPLKEGTTQDQMMGERAPPLAYGLATRRSQSSWPKSQAPPRLREATGKPQQMHDKFPPC